MPYISPTCRTVMADLTVCYRLKGISPLFRVLHQSIPKVGTLVFFASCLNIWKILQERRKSGRTATEKEKSPYWLQSCNSKGREETVY